MNEKAAQPGATDNPDDVQRLREDHRVRTSPAGCLSFIVRQDSMWLLDFIVSLGVLLVFASPFALIAILYFIARWVTCRRSGGSSSNISRFRRGALRSFAALVLFVTPAVLATMDIKGRRKEAPFEHHSPDRSQTLSTQLFYTFPISELIDPKVLLEVKLKDVQSGNLVAKGSAVIYEDSDYRLPTVTWTLETVVVRGFNDGRGEITLKR